LVIFTWMTQMHERYAYAALIVVLLLIPEGRVRWFALALAVVFTLNLFAAVPASPDLAALIPIGGLVGLVGSVAFTAISTWALVESRRSGADRASRAP
jgi:hypothetical protein